MHSSILRGNLNFSKNNFDGNISVYCFSLLLFDLKINSLFCCYSKNTGPLKLTTLVIIFRLETDTMLKYLVCLLGLLTVSAMNQNPVVQTGNLRSLFESVKPYSDLSTAFYSIKGSSLLGDKFLDTQSAKEVCDFAKAKADKNNLESIYYATSLALLMPNCQLDTSAFKATLDKGDASTTVADLFYYVNTAEILKIKIDDKKVAKSLTDALKTDSSIVNQGFSLHIAAKLAENNKPFYDSIEDILDQADEVDGTQFQVAYRVSFFDTQ